MPKYNKAELHSKMLETIFELEQEGRLTTAALIDRVLERYPDLCDREKDRLFRSSLSDRGRRLMKSARSTGSSEQMVLPMFMSHLEFPTRISVPQKQILDADTGELVQADDVRWVLLREATFDQLAIHIGFLADSIENDQARLRALQTLHDYLQPFASAASDTSSIGVLLERLERSGKASELAVP